MLKKKSELTITRMVIQAGFLLLTFLIGLRHLLPGESSKGGSFDAFCPFGAIETMWIYITSGETLISTNLLNFSILLAVVGVSLFAGRAFCGWMCPLGTLQDYFMNFTNRIVKNNKYIGSNKKYMQVPVYVPQKLDKWLRYLKYIILILILLASMVAISPPLHEICPARAIFSFQLNTPLLGIVLVVFILSSMLIKRFTCKYLCPLGASLAIFNKISLIHIDFESQNCSNCGICELNCSMDIQSVPENKRSLECIHCLECLETCDSHDAVSLKLL